MWDKIKEIISPIAPIIGGALGGPVGAAAGLMLKKALLGNEQASDQELLQAVQSITPEQQVALKQADYSFAIQMRQLDVQSEQNQLQADTAQQQQVSETIRTELSTDNKFKSYWRPMFGYAIVITWIFQTVGIVAALLYVVICQPQHAGIIIHAIEGLIAALATQWGIALAVLGINIRQRSKDKEVVTGNFKPGIAQALIGAISYKK